MYKLIDEWRRIKATKIATMTERKKTQQQQRRRQRRQQHKVITLTVVMTVIERQRCRT